MDDVDTCQHPVPCRTSNIGLTWFVMGIRSPLIRLKISPSTVLLSSIRTLSTGPWAIIHVSYAFCLMVNMAHIAASAPAFRRAAGTRGRNRVGLCLHPWASKVKRSRPTPLLWQTFIVSPFLLSGQSGIGTRYFVVCIPIASLPMTRKSPRNLPSKKHYSRPRFPTCLLRVVEDIPNSCTCLSDVQDEQSLCAWN